RKGRCVGERVENGFLALLRGAWFSWLLPEVFAALPPSPGYGAASRPPATVFQSSELAERLEKRIFATSNAPTVRRIGVRLSFSQFSRQFRLCFGFASAGVVLLHIKSISI